MLIQRPLLVNSIRVINTALQTRHALISSTASVTRFFHTTALNKTLIPSLRDKAASNNDSIATSPSTIDRLFDYCCEHSTPLPEKFDHLHAHSIKIYPVTATKTVSALQGQFQQILMRLTNPKSVLELGTFMGYSAMAMADGMPKGSVLYTCEKDPKAAHLSRELFESLAYSPSTKNPEAKRKDVTIEVIEGNGLDSLGLLAKRNVSFDAVFLDADKSNYVNYFNFILDNNMLNNNGYIIADNVLFSGLVLNSGESKKKAAADDGAPSSSKGKEKTLVKGEKSKKAFQKFANHMDTFNKLVQSDPRVDVVLLPVFDGLSLIMKRRQQ